MRKIIALAMATLMVVAMAFTAFAVNITINPDSTFTSGTSGSDVGKLYTWYRIFTATMDPSSGTTTGGGSGSFWYESGTGLYDGIDAKSFGNVAYTASETVANLILAAGTKDSGTGVITSPYFILTPIEGTNTYSVKWDETKNDNTGANIRLAADWLLKNVASKLPDSEKGSFTYANGAWTADVGTAGYYLIESAVGKNLIAATTDIEINEKNVYPSLDKTQADEDSGTHTDDNISVAVGDVIDYQIKVTVPGTIKSGDILTVWDTVTKGLTLTGAVEVSVDGTTVTSEWPDDTSVTGYAWRKTLTITDSNITKYAGKEVIFTYSMTVTSDALVDTDKENTAGLEFGDGSGTYFETVPDTVGFDTYFGGIVKMDGNTEDLLPGVTFTLYETFSGTTAEYPVVLSGSYYYPATSGTSGSAVVTTNSSGTIIIRGLDDDKDYTLVELATLPGYNLLSGSVALTLQKDDGSGTYATTELQPVLNFSGTVLPSTGGIGTTIFYVVGGLLAVGAGVVLVTKKRMSKEDV